MWQPVLACWERALSTGARGTLRWGARAAKVWLPAGRRPFCTLTRSLPSLLAPQAPGGCNVTWQEVAKEQQGLSLLAGVLGQEQVASALPGPGEANTLFAPTDAAFFNMLATLSECVGGGRAGACWLC